MQRERQIAVFLLILTAVLWSTGGVLIKWVTWHAMAIAGMRSAMAAAFLWVVLRRPQFTWSRLQLGGAVAYTASVLGFVLATKLTTAANAIVLVYTAPIYVALLSPWFLQEHVTRLDWLALGLVIGGMGLFFLDHLTIAGWWGNVCAIISGIATAWVVLCLRKQHSASTLETVLLGNLLTALVGAPFMFHTLPDLTSWVALALAGIGQIGLAFVLYTRAIQSVSALEAILIPVIEPLLNPLWVLVLIGEAPGRWALLGGAVVIIAVTARGLLTAAPAPAELVPPRRDGVGSRTEETG
jgi:drug/metabolite transporter (DMT)-like permease